MARGRTTPTTTCSPSRAPRRTASACSCASPTCRRCRARAYRLGPAARGPLARGAQHRLHATTAAATSGNLGGVEAEPIPWHEQPYSAEIDAAAARGRLAGAGRRLRSSDRERRWSTLGAPARRDAARDGTRRVPRLGAARAIESALRSARGRATSGRRGPEHGVYEIRARPRPATTTASVVDGQRAAGPLLALAARGPARPVARASTRRRSSGRRTAAGRRRSRTSCIYELHVGTFTAGGHVRRGDRAPRRARRARRHRDRADAGRRVPRRPRLGLRRRLHLRAARRPTAGPTASPRLVDAAHGAGLAVILDVVYNHVGASGAKALERVRPVLHRRVRDPLGRGRSTTTTPVATPVREWVLAERRDAGSATSTSTACGSTRSTRSSTRAPSTSSPSSPRARARRAPRRRSVIAESGAQRPDGDRAPPRDGGWGCDAAWADDFHHALRTLLTDERDGYYADFGARRAAREGLPPSATSTTAATRRSASRRFGAPADGRARRSVRRLLAEPRPGRQPRARRPAAARRPGRWPRSARCCRRSRRCCSWARSTARTRRSSSSPTTSTRSIADATREGRRREFAAFAEFARGDPRPAGPGHVRALEADARGRPGDRARSTRGLLAGAGAAAARATPTCRLRRGRRWLRVRRGDFELVCNFATMSPASPVPRGRSVLATHRRAAQLDDGASSCRRCRGSR